MSQETANRENLEHEALAAMERQNSEPAPYVERPKSQRILALILAGVVIVGVILYFCWIAGILK